MSGSFGERGSGSWRRISLGLLGGFELSGDDRPIVLPPAAQRVIALLALRRRPLTRLQVAVQLWPETEEKCARSSLRAALTRLGGTCRQEVLLQTGAAHLSLRPGLDIDVVRHLQAVEDLDRAGLAAGRVELFQFVELLPDWHDEWLLIDREELRQCQLRALEKCAECLSDAGRFDEAIRVVLVALREEPLRETAHRLLILTHLREGNRIDARRQWQLYRGLLKDRLGLAPSFHWRELIGHRFVTQPSRTCHACGNGPTTLCS